MKPGRPRTREPRKTGTTLSKAAPAVSPNPPDSAKQASPKSGRPTEYTPERAAQVLEHLSGGKSLRKTCDLEGMPCRSTFLKWVAEVPGLPDQYALARECGADALADEVVDLADEAKDRESAAVQKIKIEARQWHASKMKPRKYGEFHRTELTGDEGGPLNFRNMSDEQLDARLGRLFGIVPNGKNGNGHAPGGAGPAPAREQAPGVLPR